MSVKAGRSGASWRNREWIIPAGAALFVLGLMSNVLLGPPGRVFSADNADMAQLFIPWRTFGFGQLRQGRFPFWDPHVYSGMPFLANAQAAMLYPFNVIYLAMDPIRATNLLVGLHLFLAIVLTAWWCRLRGVEPLAALFGGVAFVCSGSVTLHLYDGHLTYLCSIPWVVLSFICIDNLIDRPARHGWGWMLLGIGSCAMLMSCGYPQFAAYTALIAGICLLLRLPACKNRPRAAAMAIAMLFGGALLSAAQLATTYEFSTLSSRSDALSPQIAGSYSLTPENLLTLLVPAPFGDMISAPYVGRWLYYEQSLWIGLGVMVLAGLGAMYAERSQRRFALSIALVCMLASLGDHTPFFWLIDHMPGINRFRAPSRFSLYAALMLAPLAALGVQSLLSTVGDSNSTKRITSTSRIGAAACSGAIAIALIVLGLAFSGADGVARMLRLIDWMSSFGTSLLKHGDPEIAGKAASYLAWQAFVGAAAAIAFGGLLLISLRYRPAGIALIALAAFEILLFAFHERADSSVITSLPPPWASFLRSQPPDTRVVVPVENYLNASELLGYNDVWGYDAVTLRRYTQLMAITQGADPATADYSLELGRATPWFALLRCSAIFAFDYTTPIVTPNPEPSMGHVALFGRYQVRPTGPAVWESLADPSFDLRHELVLESPPIPAPQPTADAGNATAIDRDCNTLEITADLNAAQILLVTDAYAPGWQATPIDAGPQDHYDVLPADNALRAIPLAAGHHHILLQYMPPGWKAGCVISLTSFIAYLAAIAWWLKVRPSGLQHDER